MIIKYKRFFSNLNNLKEYKNSLKFFNQKNYNKCISELNEVKNILSNAKEFKNKIGANINKNLSLNYFLLKDLNKSENFLKENYDIFNDENYNNVNLWEFYFYTNIEKLENLLNNCLKKFPENVYYINYDYCLSFIKKDFKKINEFNIIENNINLYNIKAVTLWLENNDKTKIKDKIIKYFTKSLNLDNLEDLEKNNDIYKNENYIITLLNLGEFFIDCKNLDKASNILSIALKNLKYNDLMDLRFCRCMNLLSIIGVMNNTLIQAEGLLNKSLETNYVHNSYDLYQTYNILNYLYKKEKRNSDIKISDKKIEELEKIMPDYYKNLIFLDLNQFINFK